MDGSCPFDTLSAGPSNVVAERPSRWQADDAYNFNDRLSQLGTKESDVYREAGQQPLKQADDRALKDSTGGKSYGKPGLRLAEIRSLLKLTTRKAAIRRMSN